MFGPAQAAVAQAVVDSVAEGVIPKDKADDYVIVCGVFIPGDANDDAKIYKYNYEADQAGHPAGHEGRAEDRRDHRQEGRRSTRSNEVAASRAVRSQDDSGLSASRLTDS